MKYLFTLIIFSYSSFSYVYPSLNYAINKTLETNKKIVISIGFEACPPCKAYKKNFLAGNHSNDDVKKDYYFVNIDTDFLKRSGVDLEKPTKDCNLKRTVLGNEILNQEKIYKCFYNSGELVTEGFPYTLVFDPSDQSIYKIKSEKSSAKLPYDKLTSTLAFESYSPEIGVELNKQLKAITNNNVYKKISLEELSTQYLETLKAK